ncbi:MAG: porin [Paracoccaceae bacterium]
MKRILVSAAAASFVAGSALAGGYTPPVVEAPIITPVAPIAVSDWTGFYAGLQYGTGTAEPATLGDPLDDTDFDAYGVHAGYLHDMGTFVLGAELDYNNVDLDGLDFDSDMIRLRARGGYDIGRVMPYLTAGVARLSVDTGAVSYTETGMTYGIGVDFKATERFTVGLEYSRQDFDNSDDSGYEVDADMIQLRASYRF